MTSILTPADLIKINSILGYSPINKNLVGSCLSSIDYISSLEMKISSIVRGIVKNHAFRDGNKRTAVLVYYSLCDRNKLKPKNSSEMFSIIIDIAKSNYTLEQVKDKLF